MKKERKKGDARNLFCLTGKKMKERKTDVRKKE
jgi:hypothetical protein